MTTTKKTPTARKAAVPKKTAKSASPKTKAATPKKSVRDVTLKLNGIPGQIVFVAGSFNNWDKTSHPMVEQDGVYITTLCLEVGVYEYKFLVNDNWTLDPDPTCDWTQNAFGTLNSLLRVGE